jgi:tetratricopeptide (TPR) repeat protein
MGQIIWPSPRSVLYPVGEVSLLKAGIGALLLAAITLLVIRQMRRQPWLLVGWFWFLGTLTPVIGAVKFSHFHVADRYTYLPSVGLGIMGVFGAAYLLQSLRSGRRIAAIGSAAVLAACVLATHADLPRWRDSVSLFAQAQKLAAHPVALGNLASGLYAKGDYNQAQQYASELIKLMPKNAAAYNTRALAQAGLGNWDAAIRDYTRAIELKPDLDQAWNNRGNAYLTKGDLERAIQDFNRALLLRPVFTEALNNRAFAWCSKGEYQRAIADCSQAIAINPQGAQSYNGRGNTYNRMGDYQKALADYDKVVELLPTYAAAYNNRASAHLALKQYELARLDVERCRRLGGTPNEALVKALEDAGKPSK